MTGGLPIGVSLGSIGATASWWLESARRLDAAGYRGVWSWDHFVGKGLKTVPVVEQWTILAAAAGATSRIGLGTFVTNVMNRHPAVVARMASTLQEASGGRFTLGIGIGGAPAEHRAYGIDFPEVDERAARLEEAVAVIRALWTGGPITRPSPFYPLENAHAFPVPDPAPRILVGASSPRGVRIAARLGDGWAAEIEDFERLLPVYREALAAEGRSLAEEGRLAAEHRSPDAARSPADARSDDAARSPTAAGSPADARPQSQGRSAAEAHIVVGFGTGNGKSGQDALGGSPWIEAPRETWARYAAMGVDEAIVGARTTNDVDALVAAVDRW